jgi:hypothetical protein
MKINKKLAIFLFVIISLLSFLSATTRTCNSCATCDSQIDASSYGDIVQLTGNINSAVSSCINIDGNLDGITLDCQNNKIIGDSSSTTIGIYVDSLNENTTIKNCIVEKFTTYGINYAVTSGYGVIQNSNFSGNANRNTILTGNISVSSVIIDYSYNLYQNYSISNYEFNETTTSNAGAVICDGCTNITIKNLNLGHNNWAGVQVGSNSTIFNVNISNCYDGIRYGQYNNISNVKITNVISGIRSYGTNQYNIIESFNIENSTQGINLGTNNNFTDGIIKNATSYGIFLRNGNNLIFDNITISNSAEGIHLQTSSDNNKLINSKIENCSKGVYIPSSTSNNNIFYNNIFNNSINYLNDVSSSLAQFWNTTSTSLINIVGGTNIGGNFWAYPNGTGFSETCSDSDKNGFCDTNYTLDSGNLDYLPLTYENNPPVITLPIYINGTYKNSSQILTLNISVTDITSSISVCIIDVNGTNQTLTYSDGWCNSSSIYLTGLTEGNKTIKVYANDSANNFGLNDSFVVQIDNTAPNITINTPSGEQTSLTIPYNISLVENNAFDTCRYWVMRGASVEVANTTVTCNETVNGTLLVTSDVTNYVFHFFVNDTAGNSNHSNSSFNTQVGTTPPPSSGGGNPTIEGKNETLTFQILSLNRNSFLDISLTKNSVRPRTSKFIIINKETTPIDVQIVCNATNLTAQNISICDYISSEQTNFTVSQNEQDPIVSSFTILTPPGSEIDDEYFFNIYAVSNEDFAKLSVSSSVTIWAYFYKWSYVPFTEQKYSYPVWTVSLVILIIVFFAVFIPIAKSERQFTGFILGLILSAVAFILGLVYL